MATGAKRAVVHGDLAERLILKGAVIRRKGRMEYQGDRKDYATSCQSPRGCLPNDFAIHRHEAGAFSDEAARRSFFTGICVSRSARIWKTPGIRCPMA